MEFLVHLHVCKQRSFTSSFPVWLMFISFYHLIALTKTSGTVLKKSRVNRHLCFVLDLREKVFNLSLLNIMLAVACYGLYYVDVCSFHAVFAESFIMKGH